MAPFFEWWLNPIFPYIPIYPHIFPSYSKLFTSIVILLLVKSIIHHRCFMVNPQTPWVWKVGSLFMSSQNQLYGNVISFWLVALHNMIAVFPLYYIIFPVYSHQLLLKLPCLPSGKLIWLLATRRYPFCRWFSHNFPIISRRFPRNFHMKNLGRGNFPMDFWMVRGV